MLPLATAVWLAVGLAGCESTGTIATRTQEKSAAYAASEPWEKKYIDKGTVAVGFTPDMVYMAMGHPTKIDAKDFPAGHAELWIYRRFYPKADAIRGFGHSPLSLDSAFQRQRASGPPFATKLASSHDAMAEKTPVGEERLGNQSIGRTGGPQSGSMEPADVPSYTIQVLFEAGQAVRLSAVPTAN